MVINFILPFYAKVPGGGTKVMYEYANRLAYLGHDVVVYHSLNTPYMKYPPFRTFIVRKLISLILYFNIPRINWFKFQPNVKLKFLNFLNDQYVRDADATISTWWSLVEPLSKLNHSKGTKVNLIQAYEIWGGMRDLVHDSYRIENVKHVVVSPFLGELVSRYNRHYGYIPNGIDYNVFFSQREFLSRVEKSFCMLYAPHDYSKGSKFAIEAFAKLKQTIPDINLTIFSTSTDISAIPDWVTYIHNPDNLNELYNSHRYFVSNSLEEGWGLPIHEALACGNIVLCTDIPGHKQFMDNFDGVYTYQAGDSNDLVDKIVYLLERDERILNAESKMNAKIKDIFNWDNAVQKLLTIIKV